MARMSGDAVGAVAGAVDGAVLIERLDPADVDVLSGLWQALHQHHIDVAPHLEDIVPSRSPEDSWVLRREKYVGWLASPDGFALLATGADGPVGYALARVVDAEPGSWERGSRVGVLESLALLPEQRGAGVGSRLLGLVRSELRARGVRDLQLAVVATNDAAMRFYRREGLVPFVTTVVGTTDEPSA